MKYSQNRSLAKPRYRSGDKVSHKTKKIKGTIQNIINLGDADDINRQGYRYSVLMGREVWSIPESYLLADRSIDELKAISPKNTLPTAALGALPPKSNKSRDGL